MMGTKPAQRVLGAVLIAIGVAVGVWVWSTAVDEGHFRLKLALLPPFMAAMGLAMMLFPIDKDRLFAEHGVTSVQNLTHYPLAWKVFLVLGVLSGLGNVAALKYL